jgi:hypothetical protein
MNRKSQLKTKSKRKIKNKKKTFKNKNKKIKRGGNQYENYKIKIREVAEICIENIHLIYSLPHLDIIDKELNKINIFLEDLIGEIQNNQSISNNDQLYIYIKSTYEKYNLKLYHFNDNKTISTSSLLFINVLENEITLMKQMINLVNKINTLPVSTEYDIIKNRYINVCNEFTSQIPCLEQFVTTIYPRVIKPLEELLQKFNNAENENNVLPNNVKEKMNLNDFHNDGDFNKYYNPTYELHQYILLSLISFRKSLCNGNNNCNNNDNNISSIKSYNENNYKQYLEYIHFFDNEKYKTNGIDWNELKKIYKSYLLDLPNESDFENENMCCLNELKDRQQQIIGGRKLKRK